MNSNLLGLAKKIDSLNSPEFRERLRLAIENSADMSATDKADIEKMLALGEEMKTVLGEQSEEFEVNYDRFISAFPKHVEAAELTLRIIGIHECEAMSWPELCNMSKGVSP